MAEVSLYDENRKKPAPQEPEFMPGHMMDKIEQVGENTVQRYVTIKPSMCGYNTQFVGYIGDVTWETVGLLCGINSFKAFDRHHIPTYLSFYFYQILGNDDFYLHRPSFGDRLKIVSSCYELGSESIVTFHRISYGDQDLPPVVSGEEFHHNRHDKCLYVQNFNRWIQRGEGGNENLCSASPAGFKYQHLPRLPTHLSPRIECDQARRAGGFQDHEGYVFLDENILPYTIDMTRDINGVGLLYFASYFAMADQALAFFWKKLKRTPRSFLDRKVTDQRILYVGNADAGTRLLLKSRRLRHKKTDHRYRFEINIMEEVSQRLLAIISMDLEE